MNFSHKTVDEYIAGCPPNVRLKLKEIRALVREMVPEAEEKISYGIPTFTYHGNLLHFAGYKTHIGFYPGSGPIKEFAKELIGYETAKGTIRFPLDKSLPLPLIRSIVGSCIKRNTNKIKR